MATSNSRKQKNSHKPFQKERICYMTVKQLRECFAGISPCPYTFAHRQVDRQARAQLTLLCLTTTLTEAPDGTLEPFGYTAEFASLLQALDPTDTIRTIITPKASAPAARPLPLLAEINRRPKLEYIKIIIIALFTYWKSRGIKNLSLRDIAHELSLSASTYSRKIGLTYPLQDIPTPQNSASATAQEVSTHKDQVSPTLPDAVIHADTTLTNAAEAITPDEATSTIETNTKTQRDHMPSASMELDLFSAAYRE